MLAVLHGMLQHNEGRAHHNLRVPESLWIGSGCSCWFREMWHSLATPSEDAACDRRRAKGMTYPMLPSETVAAVRPVSEPPATRSSPTSGSRNIGQHTVSPAPSCTPPSPNHPTLVPRNAIS